MNEIKQGYLNYLKVKDAFETTAAQPAQRMLNFLNRVCPRGYLDFHLEAAYLEESAPFQPLNEYRLVPLYDEKDFLYYEGLYNDLPGGYYFVVPFDYIDDPDAFEATIMKALEADQEIIEAKIKPLLGITNHDYEVMAYPSSLGEERFMDVSLHASGEYRPETSIEVLDEFVSPFLSSANDSWLLYDKKTNLLYLKACCEDGLTMEELVVSYPDSAHKYLFSADGHQKPIKFQT